MGSREAIQEVASEIFVQVTIRFHVETRSGNGPFDVMVVVDDRDNATGERKEIERSAGVQRLDRSFNDRKKFCQKVSIGK